MNQQHIPISASIITLNEEQNIRDCLKSVDFCAEKVVVDSGSTDKTTEIARAMGATVYVHPFEGYWQQKQWALEHCTKEWVFCLDADERITEELREFLLHIYMNLNAPPINGYALRRRHIFMGRRMSHSALYPDYKLRFVKREKAGWGGVNPHDTLIVQGRTKKLPYEITHYAWTDARDYLSTQLKYAKITAGEKYKAGARASFSDLTLRPFYTFLYRYFIRLGILDGFPGFVISAGGAAACLAKYIFLREMQGKT